MKGSSLVGYALTLGIAAALPAGCGGAQSGVPAQLAARPAGAATKSSTLLYVLQGAHAASVEFVTFPQGKPVGTLPTYGYPTALCSDASGNVWVPFDTGGKVLVAEFAHGGTVPIAKLLAPLTGAHGCAVDPSSGNLAVLSSAGINGSGKILVWNHAVGKPASYHTWFEPFSAAYDDKGNLFVDGLDESTYVLTELPAGARKLHYVAIRHGAVTLGGVQWDGTYVAVEGFRRSDPIYRLKVAGFKAEVVQTVQLRAVPYEASFWTNGSTIVATQRDTKHVGVWTYPTGGAPTERLNGFHDATGVVISVGT
jgi:hypothetical protein